MSRINNARVVMMARNTRGNSMFALGRIGYMSKARCCTLLARNGGTNIVSTANLVGTRGITARSAASTFTLITSAATLCHRFATSRLNRGNTVGFCHIGSATGTCLCRKTSGLLYMRNGNSSGTRTFGMVPANIRGALVPRCLVTGSIGFMINSAILYSTAARSRTAVRRTLGYPRDGMATSAAFNHFLIGVVSSIPTIGGCA